MNMCRRCGYLGTNYYELGLALHVAKYRLDNIAKNSKGDLDRCIIECLLAWLRDPEITDEKTWETLIAALRSIGEDAIAEKFYCESMYVHVCVYLIIIFCRMQILHNLF